MTENSNILLFPGVVKVTPSPVSEHDPEDIDAQQIRSTLVTAESVIKQDLVTLGYDEEGEFVLLTGNMTDERLLYMLGHAMHMVYEGPQIEDVE